MFKYVTLSLLLAVVNGQFNWNNGINGRNIISGNDGTQYILVPVGAQQDDHAHVQVQPQIQRQFFSVAPQRQVIQTVAPRVISAPVVQPRPVVLRAQAPARIEEQWGPAEPYTFGYQSTDEQGNSLSRSETSDGSGAVRGSYSYTDANGLNRIVEYVADAAGYRANVKTNEPGTANANPADVQVEAQEAPAAVQQLVAQYSVPKSARLQ